MRRRRAHPSAVLFHEERKRNHNRANAGEHPDGVDVGQCRGLLLQYAVHLGVGALQAVRSSSAKLVSQGRGRIAEGRTVIAEVGG